MPESELERSDLLRLLAPVQCNLTQCFRSDQTIHDFCMRCREESADVDELIAEARTLFRAKGEPQRYKVIARDLAYHGTTLGALAISGYQAMREPFEPLPPGAFHARHTCAVLSRRRSVPAQC